MHSRTQSFLYHMKGKNNRTTPMRSHALTWRVSGPSRKATLSLICLVEASRPDLTSPAYSRPSHIPLWSPFTILSRNTFYYLTTCPRSLRLHCVYPVSPLCPALCPALRPASSSCHSHVLLRSPAFSHVILCLRLAFSAVLSSLECSVGSPDRNQ